MNHREKQIKQVERAWLKRIGRGSIFSKKKKKASKPKRNTIKGKNTRFNFYRSERWVRLRKKVFATYGSICMKCGASDSDVDMQVDHIKPRSNFPELEYDFNNLQVLCASCNSAKSNLHCTDYRRVEDSSIEQYFGIKSKS